MLREEIRLELKNSQKKKRSLERLEWDLGVPVGKPSELLWQRDEHFWQYGEIVPFAKNPIAQRMRSLEQDPQLVLSWRVGLSVGLPWWPQREWTKWAKCPR